MALNAVDNAEQRVDVFIETNTRPLYCRTFADAAVESSRSTTAFAALTTFDHTDDATSDEVDALLSRLCLLFERGADSCDWRKAVQEARQIVPKTK